MKKRNILACIFMAVAIAVAIPVGINRSLMRLREDVTLEYYYDQAGYSIDEGVEKRREAAKSLLTLAQRYKDSDPELEGLMDTLDYFVNASENAWDDTFTAQAQANSALDAPAEALADALNRGGLNEKDKKYPDQLIKQMRSEQDKIDRSSYNEEVRAFNAKVESLAPMALVKPMADFSAAADVAGQKSETVKAAETAERASPPEAPEAPEAPDPPEAPDLDDFEQQVEQWADGLAQDVEGRVAGFVDEMTERVSG